MTTETISTKSGVTLLIETLIEKRMAGDRIRVSIQTETHKKCVLHWGLLCFGDNDWHRPPESVWPKGTSAFDRKAVRTPFADRNSRNHITIRLEKSLGVSTIPFVLYFPGQNTWDNNNGKDYTIALPGLETRHEDLIQFIKDHAVNNAGLYTQVYTLENNYHLGVAVTQSKRDYRILLATDMSEPVVLHWGVANHSRQEWSLPPSSIQPPNTTVSETGAAQTAFKIRQHLKALEIVAGKNEAPPGIAFVVRIPNSDIWLKNRGRNFFVPVIEPPRHKAALKDSQLGGLADEIIAGEMGSHSWTLMHRFNLCFDLLDKVTLSTETLALIFVWLRFSAIRQLDWQRRYNTKPRELSHAQDRLTQKLAGIYARKPSCREFVRLILTTLGRGGEGQRVRDEVLNIMHRHHIKEVSGHFMEEWHQKLHNNTTPDDVVICEAYLEFLGSNGDPGVFYNRLERAGVTKERLESYERPIVSAPDFIPHLKDALIHDFGQFLKILKSVHAGADLETAIQVAGPFLDPQTKNLTDFVLAHRSDAQTAVVTMAEKIGELRRRLSTRIKQPEKGLRDLLFLDLALEDFLRVVIERNLQADLGRHDLAALTTLVLASLVLTTQDEETACCLSHWQGLVQSATFKKEWSLEAKAVSDRIGRVLGVMVDQYHQILQPKAEWLGRAFRAEPWSVSLFTEEVVRGRLFFPVSTLLAKIDPLLRKTAHLGNWQVISPGQGTGQLTVVKALRSVQGKDFSHPTVILADNVSGEEEIPRKVTAVLTADSTDIVSHVAIRARNNRVVFATCYEPKVLAALRRLEGRWISVKTGKTGDVFFEEATEAQDIPPVSVPVVRTRSRKPAFSGYALAGHAFNEKVVGGKSNNLKRLEGNLPRWIGLPGSAALPFGVFEKVLSQDDNTAIAEHYKHLTGELDETRPDTASNVLSRLRQAILELRAPDELQASLQSAMGQAGLPWPENWEDAWTCIKKVWASKWNERAYLSRLAMGIAHQDLFMAVLIQRVVNAEVSFVIHTANPFSKDRAEVFAEVVPGLGETLVGNYPGRALSFTCDKNEGRPVLRSFPSKSTGLFGGGIIFRSDSNGEDLADFAGAGLYESVTLELPREILLDYTKTPLVTDYDVRDDLMRHITAIGVAVENVLGRPQDVEGAYSEGKYVVVQTRPQVGLENA